MKSIITLILFVFISTSTLLSQTIMWNGGAGNWDDTANWDCGCIPGPTNLVIIPPASAVTIEPGTNAMAERLNIDTSASVENNDTLTVGSSGNNSLVNEGTFTNNGHIFVTDGVGVGIRNFGTFINNATIKTDSIDATAISSEGGPGEIAIFHNYGEIDVVGPPSRLLVNNSSYAHFFNHPNALINIVGGDVFGNALTVTNFGFIDNHGTINCLRGELSGSGRMRNCAEVNIHHPLSQPGDGLFIATFINEPTGTLSIKNCNTAAMFSNDTIINHGTMTVDSAGGDAILVGSGSYWLNEGLFSVNRGGRFLLNVNGTVFNNGKNGTVVLNRALDNCLDICGSSSTFFNRGLLLIDSAGTATGGSFGNHGIRLALNGGLVNDTCGVIQITNSLQNGITKSSGNTRAENFGSIIITNCNNGILSGGNSGFDFFNRSTGSIEVYQPRDNGINCAGTGFFGNGFFTNQGYIYVDTSYTDYAIQNVKTFVNDTCGVIVTDHRLRNSSSFTNYGYIHASSNVPHVFTGGNGRNFGVIADVSGLFGATNLVNNRIILSPKSATGCSKDTINAFLDLGDQTGYSVTGVYADAGATVVAGVFDSTGNYFVPGAAGSGLSQLYVVFRENNTNCIDTLPIRITSGCPVNCPNDPITWTACGLSADWGTASNWSRGSVPGTGDTVQINGAPAGLLFPEITGTRSVKKLNVFSGAELTVKSGGELNVQD